jgi:hypothetical protein
VVEEGAYTSHLEVEVAYNHPGEAGYHQVEEEIHSPLEEEAYRL